MRSSSCFPSAFLLHSSFSRCGEVLSHMSLRNILDHCIDTSREVHHIQLCYIVHPSLCMKFSWFCSFHSTSIPRGLTSSYGIPPDHYSFQHNSIPLLTDTTTCSTRRWSSHFSFFCATMKKRLSLWGINLTVVWLDQRAHSLLKSFGHGQFP